MAIQTMSRIQVSWGRDFICQKQRPAPRSGTNGTHGVRKTRADLHRPFRTPWVPFVPIMGILCCAGLMATLPMDTWIRLIVWLLIGFTIYFGYSRRHSVLQKELAAGVPQQR